MMSLTKITNIARICHEANRAFCQSLGDNSQLSWDEAPQWQRDSAIRGVEFRLINPHSAISTQHEAWSTDKLKDGWVYGEVKDAEKKTHPCLVPFDCLPVEQQQKDKLFAAIVLALA